MSLFKFTGQSPSSPTSLSWSMSDHEVQDAIRFYTSRSPQEFIAPNPDGTVFAGKGQERRFPGPSRDQISSSVWSAVTDFAMNCAQDCADKIVSGKAVLLPLSQKKFPFKFFEQERLDSKAAQKQLSSRLNELRSMTISEDYEARKAVLSAFSFFLGLDLMISVEDDANRNEPLRAIAGSR